jgi:dodecin
MTPDWYGEAVSLAQAVNFIHVRRRVRWRKLNSGMLPAPAARPTTRRDRMSHHVYKIVEVVGSSTISIDDAIKVAIHEAAQSLRKLRWFEVLETRGHIEEGVVAH